jgi:hypothetical protein
MERGTWKALSLAFKIAAMGLAAATIALVILDAGDAGTYSIILAIGLFVMAVGSTMEQQESLRRG